MIRNHAMAHPLSGCWLKLARSDEHLQALQKEVRVFLDSKPYTVGVRLDPERSSYVFGIERVTEPPSRLGILLGDYVHNLRSALDHLAWQLALLHYKGRIPRGVRNQIQYPIAHDMEDFEASVALCHMAPEHRTLLQDFQPIKRTPYNNLTLIRELSNTDKHRIVHPTIVTLGDISPRFVPNEDATIIEEWYAKGKQLKRGTKIGCVWYKRIGPNPHVNMETLPVSLHFGHCPDKALGALQENATDIINRCHEHFFPGNAEA